MRPFVASAKREEYRDFINDQVAFDKSILYRPDDPEFGAQNSIKMIIETGIEKAPIEEFVNAVQSSFYRKRFYFGDIKAVTAQDSNGKDVYELVYADIVDDQMIGNYSPSYANSVANMQAALEDIELDPSIPISVDERFQPRYMSTIQSNGIPLGFIKAVPICYVLPGNSERIISRILASGFDLKNYNFETDRIIIENPKEENENGWVFYPTTRQ